MATFKFTVLPGDGIGPEVMNAALKVLETACAKEGHSLSYTTCEVGGAAIDKFQTALPESTLEACKAADAILFGSVGGPKWEKLPPKEQPERAALLPLRKAFKLFANVRPGLLYPQLTDASPLKSERIPNGIDISAVRNAIPRQRRELGIPDEAFVVGMIGRLSPQKAPDVFIRAARLIHESIPHSAFIIVGDGEERESVESFAEANHLNLYITGWTDTPYAYLKVFDVALLLSRWEGFGLAVVEYMAAEKNVVASRVDAIPTLIEDGTDGLLVEVDNPEDVRDKVLWLYNHPKEAKIMKEKALNKVIRNYDISRVVEQHADLFVKICKRG